ncbi:hypothetical protein [Pinibacter aurantiacus]|uniref:Uncharacterized protein n=1 Tax=Pinibacter aurantiacus TaxID=2851599 RepID=A0A9E2W726_9BACT|nr:hypothetical protein [Pinibacter aurantiacus]MBV4355547.1 hypothetical protein [Pinibacter aurantiacus]
MKLYAYRSILIISIFAFLLTACKKEIHGDIPPDPTAPVYGTGDYQPATEGSYWVYNYVDTKGNKDLYTWKATKDTASYDTLTYRIFVNYANSAGLSNNYIAVNSNNYFLRQNSVNGSSTSFPLSILYLNDKYYDDDTWEAVAGESDLYTVKVKGVIVAKDIAMNVNSLQFPHVMHSQVALYYDIPGVGEYKMATYDYYVALKVGLIRIDCTPSVYSDVAGFTQVIINYSIK